MPDKKIKMPDACAEILSTLAEHGHQAYIVGGCVRDALLQKEPHDWDICTDALPEEIIRIFGEEKTIPTGIKHGTITVHLREGELYEVTTFRVDGDYSDGRHPDTVRFVSELEQDLARRDFTINAMAYSDATGIVDPFGGREDLEKKMIRCVGKAEDRFEEDHLRLLRAIRFASQLGFSIEDETAQAVEQLASRVHLAAAERVGVEFFKTVTSPHAAEVFRTPAGKKMLTAIAPIFGLMDGCQQNNKYHCADVFEHTMLALENSWKCHDFPGEWADDEVRMALLLHDTGKPIVKTTDEDGHDHFYAHPAESGKIAETVLKSLRYSNDFVDTVTKLVTYHDVTFTPTKAGARRMLNKFGEKDLYRLLKIRECDNRAHAAPALAKFEELDAPMPGIIAEVLAEESAFSLKQLAVDGRDVMAACGLKPGKEVGAVLNTLLDKVMAGDCKNDKDALLSLAKKLTRKDEKPEPREKKKQGTCKILVVGSKRCSDYEGLERCLDSILKTHPDAAIVSDGRPGVSRMAERYAHEHNLPRLICLRDWTRHGFRARKEQEKILLGNSDVLVVFGEKDRTARRLAEEAKKQRGRKILVRAK